jgi:hypothetical protein
MTIAKKTTPFYGVYKIANYNMTIAKKQLLFMVYIKSQIII